MTKEREVVRGLVLITCTLALGAILSGGALAGKTANGVSWFVNGRPAPKVIQATVGREIGPGINAYLEIKARRKGPANEPLNGIACRYGGIAAGGPKGGPPAFNDCNKIPGVDICNRKPTVSAEVSGEDYGCIVPGSPKKTGSYRFRLLTSWTDFTKDPSGHTMGYDIHTFTVVVKAAARK